MALGLTVASDITNAALTFYVRKKGLPQTIQSRPLLKVLTDNQETFPSGKDNVSIAVQGQYMSDTAGFFQGYSEDDALAFAQASNLLRAAYPWREHHAGLIISFTELKKDGIQVNDDQETSENSQVELTRLTSILQNRLDDFGESWSRSLNTTLWADGTQDAKAVPGMQSLFFDTPAVGTTGGLSRSTYPWWRNRAIIGGGTMTPSGANQTLSKTLRAELRQLRRFGGVPDTALAGSAFIEALELEVQEKGLYSMEGFANNGKTDMGMADIQMRGLGKFTYDPTLDDLGMSKRCYIFDASHFKLRPMEGGENKTYTPPRPYQYMVFLKSMTWTGAFVTDQLNSGGVYEIA